MSEKLVRNKMPEICNTTEGFTPMNYRLVEGRAEHKQFLLMKLTEEVRELNAAEYEGNATKIAEEIADVCEVLRAIGHQYDITPETIEATRQTKARMRGTFSVGIIWDGKK